MILTVFQHSLCNACGLQYAKRVRMLRSDNSTGTVSPVMNQLSLLSLSSSAESNDAEMFKSNVRQQRHHSISGELPPFLSVVKTEALEQYTNEAVGVLSSSLSAKRLPSPESKNMMSSALLQVVSDIESSEEEN